MMHSLPDPMQEPELPEQRNLLAIVDLIAFALFFAAILFVVSLIKLPLVYAVPLQAVFNIAIVGFLAVWIKFVRRQSFGEFINWVRTVRFPTAYLISLGASAAVTVLVMAAGRVGVEAEISRIECRHQAHGCT